METHTKHFGNYIKIFKKKKKKKRKFLNLVIIELDSAALTGFVKFIFLVHA